MKTVLRIAMTVSLGLTAALIALADSQSLEFQVIKMKNLDERVTGIFCSSAKSCAVSTSASNGGHVYTTNAKTITGLAIDGASDAVTQKVGLLGNLDFYGLIKAGENIMAKAKVSSAFISAKGDVGIASNWSVGNIGKTDGGLNSQISIGTKDDRWVLFTDAYISESLDEPGAGALWSTIWSPESSPSDWYQMWRDSNKTLCSSVPGETKSGVKLNAGYVAPDLSIIAYLSNGGSRAAPEAAGVCLSTDGGKRFYHANLPGVDESDLNNENLNGVTCISSNRCFVFSGSYYRRGDTHHFIDYTNDAQKGIASTWAAAKLPTMRDKSVISSIFFAPDGNNGWAVGSVDSSSPLMLTTKDGGLTWKDSSASVRAVAPDAQLHSGYALDANNVWLGGNKDTLLTTTK